ncbi:Uncharacterised protein [Klebsiella variicola]|nr:Uncharacterised protein [Klebsiella variicola]
MFWFIRKVNYYPACRCYVWLKIAQIYFDYFCRYSFWDFDGKHFT